MELYTVDSDEAMKRGDEAFNGSSLQFLRSVKRFIASIFYGQFPKKFVISVISVTNSKNIIAFAYTCVLETFALFFWRFLHGIIYSCQR
jgi:hypothetical protein